MTRLALIAGQGDLPSAVLVALQDKPLVCALDGFTPKIAVDQVFRLERLALFLRYLQDQGVTDVIFAGAVQRPALDPSLFDPQTAQMVPRLLAALGAGDDGALRVVIDIFEEHGFAVRGVGDIAPHLIPPAAIYAGQITDQDRSDATRAEAILNAMGAVDIGQGCVVARGQCLAVEVITGTDAMLATVAAIPRPVKGLFYKSAKLTQDRRMDLPTLGVQSVIHAANAGLAGIVWRAGDVICLDLPAMQQMGDQRGLFLWAR
jgi:DUF1009 family protein